MGRDRGGFTFIEMMAVLLIMGLLAGISAVTLHHQREQATLQDVMLQIRDYDRGTRLYTRRFGRALDLQIDSRGMRQRAKGTDRLRMPLVLPPVFPPVEQFACIWQLNVRNSLGGPDPVATTWPVVSQPPTPIPASLRVKLLATAVDNNRSCAVFSDEQQHSVVRSVGQRIDGNTIIAIERRKVTLENQGRPIDLTLPDQYSPGGVSR
jgi:prepilin-type N-terminal cleavage/methylation domain-containing protein